LGFGQRVDAVVLHEFGVFRDAFEEEGEQGQGVLFGEAEIVLVEGPGVAGAVVGWNPHAGQQHAAAGVLNQADHGVEIVADGLDRYAAQAVVAAELEDDEFRLVLGEHRRQPLESAGGGLAADAAVDHPVCREFPFHPLREQFHPAPLRGDAVGGAETVAPDEQIALLRVGRGKGQRQRRERQRRPAEPCADCPPVALWAKPVGLLPGKFHEPESFSHA